MPSKFQKIIAIAGNIINRQYKDFSSLLSMHIFAHSTAPNTSNGNNAIDHHKPDRKNKAPKKKVSKIVAVNIRSRSIRIPSDFAIE